MLGMRPSKAALVISSPDISGDGALEPSAAAELVELRGIRKSFGAHEVPKAST